MSKKLVIVESPTKAKTISKFLGADYIVESSFGHIRDLPKSKLGVDVENNFEPTYTIPTTAKKQVTALKKIAKDADEIILATDEDREGEAIAWHLLEALKVKDKPVSRIVFHEITKGAIDDALANPRKVDQDLVDAQQARRILDRLVGYKLSPLLWSKIRRGLSAGRVQSVAMRLIVERERERKAFKIDEYWTIDGIFEKDKIEFEGKLTERDGQKVKKLDISNEEEAKKIVSDLEKAEYKVAAVTKKQASRKPPTPFKTSVLQQEANNALGFSAKQTMTVAQKLYETGYITYMRTDSLNLATKFLNEAQTFIANNYGVDYAKGPIAYKTGKKDAQEAHEAIRPTDVNKHPDLVKSELEAGQWKLYNLIWRRTVASQLPPAKLERTGIDLKAGNYTFRANGSTIVFDGFMKVYKASKEKILPELKEGDSVDAKSITPVQHFTEPPARYSDATLVKVLEEHGIGRPSTYAPTISTIIARGYVERDDNKKLYPTDIASIVTDMLVAHFPKIVDYEFTAEMENSLDEIAEGKIEWAPMLEAFYKPFISTIEEKDKTLTREEIMPDRVLGNDPETNLPIHVRTGRYGAYVQLGEWSEEDRKAKKNKPKSVSLPKSLHMESITFDQALALLELPKVVGKTKDGEDITVQIGPFGPYLKGGEMNITLPAQYSPIELDDVDVDAIFHEGAERKKKMMTPIAELGEDPNSKGEIQVKFGRYGHYITDGETNVSIKKDQDPEAITREEAIELLEKKRKAPKRSWGKKKTTTAKKKTTKSKK